MTNSPHPVETLATAQDLVDQLRTVECPFVRTLERVVTEYETMVREWPQLYRAPCSRPPPALRLRIEPEGLLDLVTRAHAAWRLVCATRTSAWQLALFLVATRLEVEKVIAHRDAHDYSRLSSRTARGAWEADDATSWGS